MFWRVWAYAGTVSRIESEQGYGLVKKKQGLSLNTHGAQRES